MILECKSCQKKFLVPDSAITNDGRLVQCSSCGNKWTQFPINKKIENKQKIDTKKNIEKKVSNKITKKRKINKRTGPSIYSKEYLEKKHGISLNESKPKKIKNKTHNMPSVSYFGFYSYIIFNLIIIVFLFGVLNLTKEMLVSSFPFLEIYIEYLYENLNNFSVLFKDAIF